MLLDATHRKWIVVTALLAVLAFGVYYWQYRTTPGGLRGGDFLGLWYGIVGSALMIFAGLLSALRHVPSWWWLGPRQTWLRGHIWLGLLSVLLIWCHSGFALGGPLTVALWIVFLLVIVTGIYGLVLQHFLPRLITSQVPCEAPYEQIPHLCHRMRQRADEVLTDVFQTDVEPSQMSIMESQTGLGAKVQLQEFYERQIRPFLQPRFHRTALLADPVKAEAAFSRLRALPGLAGVKDKVAELETLCEERRLLARQERLHTLLHSWLLLHVPLAVVLLVLSVAHVISALYY